METNTGCNGCKSIDENYTECYYFNLNKNKSCPCCDCIVKITCKDFCEIQYRWYKERRLEYIQKTGRVYNG